MSKIKDVVIDEMNRLRELECEEVLVDSLGDVKNGAENEAEVKKITGIIVLDDEKQNVIEHKEKADD